MVKIRLSRTGVRNDPFYKIVVVDEKRQIRGKVLAEAGYWFPRKGTVKIDKTIIEKWVKLGAKITPAVESILNKKK